MKQKLYKPSKNSPEIPVDGNSDSWVTIVLKLEANQEGVWRRNGGTMTNWG